MHYMNKKSKFGPKISNKSKIVIQWKDKPENYSNEAKKHIVALAAERYDIPKEMVKIHFIPTKYNDKGELIDVSTDVVNNIQDPKFQLKLFEDYINENSIENVDMDFIKKIDSEINSKIDYDVYDKYKRYEIEWLEWDNFQSYGDNNSFDFTKLNGLTLVNGVPGNMSGKSTLTVDLISFLLFGKSQKPYTLLQCFNKYTDSKTFRVCGGIKIEGANYIIDRLVTRSKKRDGSWGEGKQDVKYYEVINGQKNELLDEIKNDADEHAGKTNQVIKQAVGSEKDFNMIVSAASDDLDSLINTGNAEKGRLLSKWVGLLPIEKKEEIGKEKHKEFEKTLISKQYQIPTLEKENTTTEELILQENNAVSETIKRLNEIEDVIKVESKQKETLLLSKKVIDNNVLKIDINSVNIKIKKLISDAETKKLELENYKKQYEPIKDTHFSVEDYKTLLSLDKKYEIELNDIKKEIRTLKETNINLIENEFCPTCKRKYDGLDNSKSIQENNKKIESLTNEGIAINENLKKNKELVYKMECDKVQYDNKLKIENQISIIPVQIENLRSSYREQTQLLKDFDENKSAIELNNNIDISLINVNAKIRSLEIEQKEKIQRIENLKRNIVENTKKIETNKILIDRINKELIQIKNWNVYLEMVGKNGVSKMVLRKTLPIINSELSRILDDVCDFDVEVYLSEKNDVMFSINRNGVVSDLAGGSGFEKTTASLALRHVLGNISTMPRPNFITLDEVLGKVSREYYDNIHNLYSKIVGSYQFVLHITHIEEIKDWHKNVITINKNEQNISSIRFSKITDTNNK